HRPRLGRPLGRLREPGPDRGSLHMRRSRHAAGNPDAWTEGHRGQQRRGPLSDGLGDRWLGLRAECGEFPRGAGGGLYQLQ
ncbi:unnamed protein product, partial [Effrenium voratum]